jgi:hypothetical protein
MEIDVYVGGNFAIAVLIQKLEGLFELLCLLRTQVGCHL